MYSYICKNQFKIHISLLSIASTYFKILYMLTIAINTCSFLYILVQYTLSLFQIIAFTILINYFLVLDVGSHGRAQNDIENIEKNIIYIMFYKCHSFDLFLKNLSAYRNPKRYRHVRNWNSNYTLLISELCLSTY